MLPPSSSRLVTLPLELIDTILNHISDPLHLLAFALVSRACSTLVVPNHIQYRHIRIRHRFPRLWAHLAQRADLAARIVDLRVCRHDDYSAPDLYPRFLHHDMHQRLVDDSEDARIRNICTALSHMRSLHTLLWFSDDKRFTSTNEIAVMRAAQALPALARVHLSGLTGSCAPGFSIDHLSSAYPVWNFKNLHTLCLDGPAWVRSDNAPHIFHLLARCPSLEHLHLPVDILAQPHSPSIPNLPNLTRLHLFLQAGFGTGTAYILDRAVVDFLKILPNLQDLTWTPVVRDLRLPRDILPNLRSFKGGMGVLLALEGVEGWEDDPSDSSLSEDGEHHTPAFRSPLQRPIKCLDIYGLDVPLLLSLKCIDRSFLSSLQLYSIINDVSLLNCNEWGSILQSWITGDTFNLALSLPLGSPTVVHPYTARREEASSPPPTPFTPGFSGYTFPSHSDFTRKPRARLNITTNRALMLLGILGRAFPNIKWLGVPVLRSVHVLEGPEEFDSHTKSIKEQSEANTKARILRVQAGVYVAVTSIRDGLDAEEDEHLKEAEYAQQSDGDMNMLLRTIITQLSEFRSLEILRGRALWAAAGLDMRLIPFDKTVPRLTPDINSTPKERTRRVMHNAIGALAQACPQLRALDHDQLHARRGHWSQIVLKREIVNREGHGNSDANIEEHRVSYSVERPSPNDPFDVMGSVFS